MEQKEMSRNTLTLPKKEDQRGQQREERLEKRVPIGGNRDILTVNGKEPGFVYRWVLDTGNRIVRFKKAGYELVTHEVTVGDARAATPEGLGSVVEALSGNGNNKLVLMRIREDYYKEDQDAKENEIQALEMSMGKNVDGSYGKIEIGRK